MANFASLLKQFGLAKESVRGTAEAEPTVWTAILPESKLDYVQMLYPDETMRAVMAKYPSAAGHRVGAGTIKMPLRASDVGEFFHMLIGDPSSAQQGGTAAYLHTFTPAAVLTPDSYTFFLDRSMNVMKYNLGQVSKITLDISPDNFVMFTADVMFKSEAAGSIGTPSFVESEELTFQHVTFKIDTVANTELKSASIVLENGLFPKRVTSQSQDPEDFIVTQHKWSGAMTIYFEDATERNKFLAGTTSSLQFQIIGDTISGAYKYTVDVFIDKVQYTAFPYGDEDGLLAAAVSFEATYDSTDTRIGYIAITNINTAY